MLLFPSGGQRTALIRTLGLMGLALWATPGPVWAQAPCEPHWVPGDGFQGVNGLIRTVLPWDPDGDGPLPEQIVVGGEFTMAGGLPAGNIAMWNRETKVWSTLGGGTNGLVLSIAEMPGGGLAIGGAFTQAGNAAARSVARWDGTTWSQLGSGLLPQVFTLTTTPNGELFAAGRISSTASTIGRRQIAFVAKWDGTDWRQPGTGLFGQTLTGAVYNLTAMQNGTVLAAGDLYAPEVRYQPAAVATWDGTAWASFGLALNTVAHGIAEDRHGHILTTGTVRFNASTYASAVFRWDGLQWQLTPVSLGHQYPSATLTRLRNGDVLLAGVRAFTEPFTTGVTRWDGTRWSSLPLTELNVVAQLSDDSIVVGGQSPFGGNASTGSLALFNGVGWSNPTLGANGTVSAFALSPRGVLYAGGSFTSIGGTRAAYIATWDGASWTALGSQPNNVVRAILSLPDGDLIAAGRFTRVGDVSANGIARWDGETWTPLGTGIGTAGGDNFDYLSLASDRRGRIYVGGYQIIVGNLPITRIAAWDGEAWTALGSGITGFVESTAVMPNDDLVVGGSIGTAGGRAVSNIARWDGTEWTSLGEGLDGRVNSLIVASNGDLIAGGEFLNSGNLAVTNVARWNGHVWAPMGSAPPTRRLALLPSGHIAAAGWNTTRTVSVWDGHHWTQVGSGMTSTPSLLGFTVSGAHALAALPNGDIAVGGEFSAVDGVPSAFFARYSYGRPLLTQHPISAIACSHRPTTLGVRHTIEDSPPAYQWRKDGVPISIATNATARSSDLVLPRFAASDAGAYDCLVTNACGTTTSLGATLTVCVADFNCSGPGRRVTVQDLLEFVGAYLTNDMRADVDSSGELSVQDLLTFISAYFNGC